MDFLERDEPTANHCIQLGQNALDPFGILNQLNDDGEIPGEPQDLVGVVATGRSVASHAAQDGHTAEILAAKEFHDGFVEGLSLPLVGFTDKNPHQGPVAFEFLVFHRAS